MLDEQRRGLPAAAGLLSALPSSSCTLCSTRADTTVLERLRSMVDGTMHVPFFPSGWVHSPSTNITSVPGVTASNGTPEVAQNFAQLAQSWA
ncbi:hypothetical protein ABT090_23810 [Streptomyces asoensis]|uniref:hypothetical protein n=1 Tax=Streptomyces asoensis TaxID=249586 RepID=UPI003322E4BF